MSTEDRERALSDLVESYTALLTSGRAPSVEAFVRDYVQHADALRSVLPVLRQMHDVQQQVEAETEPPRTSERVPGRVGPYRILEQIGRGGMGRVFLATEEGVGPVALKLVHDHLVGDASFVKRFLREADIGRGIDHPNVVRTLDAGGSGHDGDSFRFHCLSVGKLLVSRTPTRISS